MIPEDLRTIILRVARKFYKRFPTMATASVTGPPPPWHAAYPVPRHTPATIRREDVLELIKHSAETSSRDYILIDLRRNDHEVPKTDRRLTLLWKELSEAGRHHPRFDQPSCTESALYHTKLAHAL
jgi:hypothetical protein